LLRRAVRRDAAGQQGARCGAGRDHRRRGRRDPEPCRVVRPAGAVRQAHAVSFPRRHRRRAGAGVGQHPVDGAGGRRRGRAVPFQVGHGAGPACELAHRHRLRAFLWGSLTVQQTKEGPMASQQNRRDFIGIAAGVALAATAADALAQGAPPKTEYAIKKLAFDPSKIKGLSEKLLTSHYENNCSGAVKRLNAITSQLAGLDMATAPVFVVNGLKREELIAANSMIIHELYFDGLGGEGDPKGALGEQLTKDFGSLARWKAEFAAVGKALGGGSGWVMLAWSPHDKKLINTWANDHTMT